MPVGYDSRPWWYGRTTYGWSYPRKRGNGTQQMDGKGLMCLLYGNTIPWMVICGLLIALLPLWMYLGYRSWPRTYTANETRIISPSPSSFCSRVVLNVSGAFQSNGINRVPSASLYRTSSPCQLEEKDSEEKRGEGLANYTRVGRYRIRTTAIIESCTAKAADAIGLDPRCAGSECTCSVANSADSCYVIAADLHRTLTVNTHCELAVGAIAGLLIAVLMVYCVLCGLVVVGVWRCAKALDARIQSALAEHQRRSVAVPLAADDHLDYYRATDIPTEDSNNSMLLSTLN